MKRFLKLVIPVAVFIMFFGACSSDTEDAGFISINGTSYALTYGVVDDYGTNDEITYRNYWIRFQSGMGEQPSHFIVFKLYSNSTTKIGEGTYNYEYFAEEAGDFEWVKVGYNLQYDEEGEKVGGTMLLDNPDIEGTIIISKEGDYNKFEFNLTIEKDNFTYTVTGEFSDVLHEDYVYYSDIKK